MTKVFIDGSAGTTGLRIARRLSERRDIELLRLPEGRRRDVQAREEMLNGADIAFLCLPDQAAEEAVGMVDTDTVIIDTSTAHRTSPGWVYGFPELPGQRERIAASRRIANPGCHASGFIALAAPLVREGLLSPDTALTCFSVTGYSGGGKGMIADYESRSRETALDAPRQYGLDQNHKHLREMQIVSGLTVAPVFCPIVSDYYSGMVVTVPVFRKDLAGTGADVAGVYRKYYGGPLVRYAPCPEGMLAGNVMAGRDDMTVTVAGNGERILLIACFDNLGKGASGAAIQNMNILLGVDEITGLNLG